MIRAAIESPDASSHPRSPGSRPLLLWYSFRAFTTTSILYTHIMYTVIQYILRWLHSALCRSPGSVSHLRRIIVVICSHVFIYKYTTMYVCINTTYIRATVLFIEQFLTGGRIFIDLCHIYDVFCFVDCDSVIDELHHFSIANVNLGPYLLSFASNLPDSPVSSATLVTTVCSAGLADTSEWWPNPVEDGNGRYAPPAQRCYDIWVLQQNGAFYIKNQLAS